MTGPEMLMSNALKMVASALKLDPEQIQKQVTEIHGTIVNAGRTVALIFSLLLMANRRLHRIETHLRLSDIEPLPEEMKVIEHVEVKSSVVSVELQPSSGR